jgi:hypothetical protein
MLLPGHKACIYSILIQADDDCFSISSFCIYIRLHKVKNQEVVYVHTLARKQSQVWGILLDIGQNKEHGSGPDGYKLRILEYGYHVRWYDNCKKYLFISKKF